jgi:hypothetical protein
MLSDALLGALIAFAIATLSTPVGVSGAVFLVPVQVSVLSVPSPSVTPTNLLYNLIAIPGALRQFAREGRLGGRLMRLLVLGTLPGVVAGAVIRVELLSGPNAFLFVIAAVLVPLGVWLALFPPAQRRSGSPVHERLLVLLALAVGVVGGVYGNGGGSILAPVLVGLGYAVVEVAPAALTATFLTSIAGVITYAFLSLGETGDIAPDWIVGLAFGVGGLLGSSLGARLQPHLPEELLRRGLGVIALGLGLRYAVVAIT